MGGCPVESLPDSLTLSTHTTGCSGDALRQKGRGTEGDRETQRKTEREMSDTEENAGGVAEYHALKQVCNSSLSRAGARARALALALTLRGSVTYSVCTPGSFG